MKRLVAVLAVSAVALTMNAQLRFDDFEKVLLPVAVQEFGGAHGSVWKTEFTMLIDGNIGTDLAFPFGPLQLTCATCDPNTAPMPTITPVGAPLRPAIHWAGPGQAQGLLFYVPRAEAHRANFSLVVRELTRTTAGTALPVVREADVRPGNVHLLDIRSGFAYRNTLRIYDLDRHPEVRARVVVLTDSPSNRGRVLADREISLVNDDTTAGGMALADGVRFPLKPSYYQVDLATLSPDVASHEGIRVVITPLDAGVRLWAFVSTTNSATNEVTLSTPQ